MQRLAFLQGAMVWALWVSGAQVKNQYFLHKMQKSKHVFVVVMQFLQNKFPALQSIRVFATCDNTLTVAPSLIDMGFAFFPIWLLMLKPILETLQGAAGLPED